MAATMDVGDEGLAESATKQVFSSYVCRTIKDRGMPHPGDVAEASSLAAVPLPPTGYPLWDSLPPDLVSSGKLSTLQLEGILYACSKHCELLPSGERAGFFIGDGAGVGKGRQIAGVIIDNFVRGRKRALWLSTSSDLHADASRDLRDLGCHLTVINNVATLDRESKALGLSKDYREGVLFMTYSTLISQVKGRSRLQQVVDWLVYGVGTNGGPTADGAGGDSAAAAAATALFSWDGLIVLDECHKAKNFVPGKDAASTKVASAVIALQERLPRARVLYCSATGVSEVGNMAYMVRMGLWGLGTAFSDFAAFLDAMRKRGVSFMEMLAMEMKVEGKYVARGLSFREAEFTEVEAPLTERQIRIYDNAVRVWSRLKTQLEAALEVTGTGRDVWKAFWSTQQRFFKLLCVSLKVPTVVSESREALAAGQCVVIGLQSTGEAAADAVGLEPGPAPGFVSPTKEMLLRFVAQHFPVRRGATAAVGEAEAADAAAGGGGGGSEAYGGLANKPYMLPSGYDEDGPVPPPPLPSMGGGGADGKGSGECGDIPVCISMREELLAAIDGLDLPANFLDEIIDQLGGPGKVAEMTGRKGRVVRVATARAGSHGAPRPRLVYELRAKPDSCEMDSLNISEKDAFLRGSKLVAIISDAASTGISLHASRAATNQRRRLHLTIELPWSADKAIQQLGRSHRSNQVSAPLYKLVSTRIGGEKRFAAAVARRLQSLGALTRGDRRAASGVDLSDSNFDSAIGRKSLRRMYDHIMLPMPVLPHGVTLADVFREHPALAQAMAPGGARSKRVGGNAAAGGPSALAAAAAAGRSPAAARGGPRANPATAKSESMVLFDFDDPAVVSLHVAALHESCRRSCELMDLDLPAPKPGSAAAEGDGKSNSSGGDVRRFLNRLLGLRVEAQGLLFAYFAAVLGAEIHKARAEGKYSEGLADVAGTRIRLQSRSTLWIDPLSKLVTTNTAFSVDRGLSWEAAKRRLERERLPGDSSGFRMSRRPLGASYLVLLALQKPGARNLFSIARPNTGVAFFDMDRSDLEAKYLSPAEPGTPGEAHVEALWRAAYEAALSQCSHGPGCRLGPECGVGRRITTVNVLSGSVVRVWGVLEAVLARRELELPKMERTLRVVRVEWDDNDDDEGDDDDDDDDAKVVDGGSAAAASSGKDDGEGEHHHHQQHQDQEQQQVQQCGDGGGGGDDVPMDLRPPGSPQVTLSCSTDDSGTVAVAATTTVDTATGPAAAATAAAATVRERFAGGRSGSTDSNPQRRRRRRQRRSSDGGDGGGPAGVSPQHHVVGVRYPAALLGEVVLALTSVSNQCTLTQLPGGAIAVQAPGAAAAAAEARTRPDPPAPVEPLTLARAFRPPRTLMHFFWKPDPTGQCASQGGPSGDGGAATGSGLVLQLPLTPEVMAEMGIGQAAAAAAVKAAPAAAGMAIGSSRGGVGGMASLGAVTKRERDPAGAGVTGSAKAEGLMAQQQQQPFRRLSSNVNSGVAVGGAGGEGTTAAAPSAPPAKRMCVRCVAPAAPAAPAGKAGGVKQQHLQQQLQPHASGFGGAIIAAFARCQQLHVRPQLQQQQQQQGKQQQQQQRRGGGGDGGPSPVIATAAAGASHSGGVIGDDDVMVSIDCSKRSSQDWRAPTTAASAAATALTAAAVAAPAATAATLSNDDVIMVDSSSSDDDADGGGAKANAKGGAVFGRGVGGGTACGAAVAAAAVAAAAAGARDQGSLGGEGDGEEEGVADAACGHDSGDVDDADGDSDVADADFVVAQEEEIDRGEKDEWRPTRKRNASGGPAGAATAAAAAAPTTGGRGRGSGSNGHSRSVDGRAKLLAGRQATVGRGGGGGGAYGGSGGSRGSGGAVSAAATVAKLQGMGFSARQAEKALWMARGDFERAVELCLQGM